MEETDERGRQLNGREADENGRNGVASAIAGGGGERTTAIGRRRSSRK